MPQVKIGTIISNKMDKTVVVKVSSRIKHPLYKKLITKTKKFKVHTDQNLKTGQKVKIVETRPISKNVHFKITEVLN